MLNRQKLLIYLIIIFIIIISTLSASGNSVIWPTEQEWNQALDADWNYITDEQGDVNQDHLDIITDPEDDKAAFAWYYDGTNMFFRMVLLDNPERSQGGLRSMAWYFFIDSTEDNYPNYGVGIDGMGGNDSILTLYNLSNDIEMDGPTGWEAETAKESVSGNDGYQYLIDGQVRVKEISGGYYLETYVPLEWLSMKDGSGDPPPIEEDTIIKIAAGTSTTRNRINADLAGRSGDVNLTGFYDNVVGTTPDSSGQGYGILRDTRYDSTITNSGLWQVEETVEVAGYGWPTSSSDYYNDGNLDIRIIGPDNSLIWEGTVYVNSEGEVLPINTWEIPLLAVSGVYNIQVEDPLAPGSFNIKDTFTVKGLPFRESVKNADQETVLKGDKITYNLEIPNSSDDTINLTITDTLDPGTNYVSGSLSIDGDNIADDNGFPLAEGYQLSVSPNETVNLEYEVIVTASNDGQQLENTAQIEDNQFSLSLKTSLILEAPDLIANKTTDRIEVRPGEQITYTTELTNQGQAAASNINIVEPIPDKTKFVTVTEMDDVLIQFQDQDGSWHNETEDISVSSVKFIIESLLPEESILIDIVVEVK